MNPVNIVDPLGLGHDGYGWCGLPPPGYDTKTGEVPPPDTRTAFEKWCEKAAYGFAWWVMKCVEPAAQTTTSIGLAMTPGDEDKVEREIEEMWKRDCEKLKQGSGAKPALDVADEIIQRINRLLGGLGFFKR